MESHLYTVDHQIFTPRLKLNKRHPVQDAK